MNIQVLKLVVKLLNSSIYHCHRFYMVGKIKGKGSDKNLAVNSVYVNNFCFPYLRKKFSFFTNISNKK